MSAGGTCVHAGSGNSSLAMHLPADQQLYGQNSVPGELNASTASSASYQTGHYQLLYHGDSNGQHQLQHYVPNMHHHQMASLYNGGPTQPPGAIAVQQFVSNTDNNIGGERTRAGAIHLQQLHCWEQSLLPDGKLAKLTRVQVVSQVGFASIYILLIS